MSEVIEFITSNKYLLAATIVIISVIAALLVNLVTTRVLMHMSRKTMTTLDDEIIEAISKPLFLSILLVGIGVAASKIAGSADTSQTSNRVLVTVGILLWMGAGFGIAKSVLAAMSRRMHENKFIQPRTVPLFEIGIKTLLVGGAAYGVLVTWEVDVTAWLASAGILGIAIGFAAKDTLSNLFSGIFILADAPYKIGDFVVLDSGERGRVTDIGIRSTRLLTRDDIQIIVPNAAIGNAKIVNESGGPHPKERVRVRVGVAYGSDVDRVREVLLDVAAKSSFVVPDPEPRVRFREFGASSLNFELLTWIEEPVMRGRALDELNTSVYKRFNEEGIKIPFPQTDVHLRKE